MFCSEHLARAAASGTLTRCVRIVGDEKCWFTPTVSLSTHHLRVTIVSPMNVTDICKTTGITRQWLNKLVDRGEVPGASRRDSGRLQIADSPEFRRWVTARSRLTTKRNRTRDQLRRDKATIKAPIEGDYTSRELATMVGCTAESIRNRVVSIPGARLDESTTKVYDKKLGRNIQIHNVYRFRDCPELREWIEAERLAKQSVKLSRRVRRIGNKAPSWRVAYRISLVLVETRRVLREYAMAKWGDAELKSMVQDLQNVLQPLSDEMSRRKGRTSD
jgi:hypothetical protein